MMRLLRGVLRPSQCRSDPIKCRWVSDFRNLNKAIKRPIWGSESSSQLLRRISPQARYFACFDAISGYHQIRVDTASQDLLNITTQMGNFKFTVLGQGICSSQDLFNYITDGNIKLDEDFIVKPQPSQVKPGCCQNPAKPSKARLVDQVMPFFFSFSFFSSSSPSHPLTYPCQTPAKPSKAG